MSVTTATQLSDDEIAALVRAQPFRIGDLVAKENGRQATITAIRRAKFRDVWGDGTYLTAEIQHSSDATTDAVRLSSLVAIGPTPSRGLADLVARYRS